MSLRLHGGRTLELFGKPECMAFFVTIQRVPDCFAITKRLGAEYWRAEMPRIRFNPENVPDGESKGGVKDDIPCIFAMRTVICVLLC